jgi:hypothetical protein
VLRDLAADYLHYLRVILPMLYLIVACAATGAHCHVWLQVDASWFVGGLEMQMREHLCNSIYVSTHSNADSQAADLEGTATWVGMEWVVQVPALFLEHSGSLEIAAKGFLCTTEAARELQ